MARRTRGSSSVPSLMRLKTRLPVRQGMTELCRPPPAFLLRSTEKPPDSASCASRRIASQARRTRSSAPSAPSSARMMSCHAVPRILCAQGDDGHWGERDRYYVAKYRGTAWQLIILAELGADGADERVRRACEAILRDAQDAESGGFSVDRSKKAGGGLHSSVIPCLTGNLVF